MDVMKLTKKRSALVAYGTETGTAHDYAEELGRLLERIHFWTHVSKLDAIATSSLNQYSLVIIVVSTTGQGELPIDARSFWKSLLRRKLPPTYFRDVQFSTFGLGDSSYPRFNWAARKLHKRLLQLGANEIYPRGEADEQHNEGLDASFVPWLIDLRNHLLTRFPLPEGVTPMPDTEILEPKWTLELEPIATNGFHESIVNGDHIELPSTTATSAPHYEENPLRLRQPKNTNGSATHTIAVTLAQNQRMTPDAHWQDVRHLVLNSHSPAPYEPGDVLTIRPKNIADDVDQILKRMDWSDVADKPIHFTPTEVRDEGSLYPPPPIALPEPITTLRSLLTGYLDLIAIPRRSFFSLIAHFTDDQFHKDRLLEFTKPECIDELYDYTTRPRRSILEVLQEFGSVKIPWQFAASVLPELRGRQFSIASGGTLKTTPEGMARFELLVAIVKYKTVIKKVREGVCTRYLAHLPVGAQLQVALQQGGLAIKRSEARRPVIMIGPGTGLAPMRSLIWERYLWLQEMSATDLGRNLLLFGCRSENADYFYRDEWEKLKSQMPLEVHAAFSRGQDQKFYVQDLIRKQSESVYGVLHESDGLVYVCGSSGKMPQAVRVALADVFMVRGKMDQNAANKYLESMEKEGRYKQETW